MKQRATLQEFIPRLRAYGEATAVLAIDGDNLSTRSFATLADEVHRLASGLLEQGIKPGETIGLCSNGSPEWVIAFLGIVAAGGMAIPLDTTLEGAALSELLKDGDCRRLFTTSDHATNLAAHDASDAPEIYLLDDATENLDSTWRPWRHIMAKSAAPLPGNRPDDPAALFYTSGTTGRPKGVPLSHANLIANIDALVGERTIGPDDRVLLPLPPHHVYPLVVGILTPLAAGAGIVFPAGISGPQIVDAIQKSDATILIGVPRLYTALLGAIDTRLDRLEGISGRAVRLSRSLLGHLPDRIRRSTGRLLFPRLRKAFGPKLWLMVSGGAHLNEETWRSLETLGWTVLTGYGLTETAPILTFNPKSAPKIGSAGKALAGVELRTADAGENEFGDIQARGPNVFSAYRNRPQETSEAFTPDGWFRTGDLGHIDEDGYLHIVGRSKELIVLPDGKNVFPEDVEAVYGKSSLIEEIGVLERDGNLAAVIVPDLEGLRSRGAESLEQLVRDEIRDLSPVLAPYQRISSHVLSRQKLPRTTIGKLRRHLLPDLFERDQSGKVHPPAEITQDHHDVIARPLAGKIWRWLEQRFPAAELTLDTSPQLDLGIDSLGWTGLSLEIEDRFDITLPDLRIARIVTLRDLIREMEEAAEEPTQARHLSSDDLKALTPLNPIQRLLNATLFGIAHIAMRALFRLRVTGIENLPETGPFIIAPNHASWLDPPVIAASLPYRVLRNLRFGGWTGLLFDSAIARGFSRIARVIPVDPDRGAASSLARARAVLSQEDILVWFPEGRRTQTGDLLPFQPGIGALTIGGAIPIVPTFITGTFEAAPSGRRLARLTRITIRFGKPLDPETLANRADGDTPEQRIANALQAAVGALRN